MNKVASFSFITALSIFLFLTSCGGSAQKSVELQEFHMGTIVSERLYGENAEEAAKEIMNRIDELERSLTINASGSEISALNDKAGEEGVVLSPEPLFILRTALKYSELSSGSFDVTVGPIVKAWGIFTAEPKVPSRSELDRLKGLVNYKDVIIDDISGKVKLAKKGQVVDLGGIAKGYAADAAIEVCRKYGIKSAFINLGGNVVVYGSKPDGSPWKIGVQNPRAENGRVLGILNVSDKAVVSSGDYERYFEKDGKRYHHILDPKTGYPSDSGLIGTTIVADKAIDADALSTAAFVLGLAEGMKLIESLQGIEAVFVTNDKKVYTTSGLKNIFTFQDESKGFEYVEKR